eukprot:GHVS01003074.1.p1 GENE.GHVS01003074.1~~GHVS01003074.1.p1  ORF type:complete len:113 (-),score=19.26 GHVS01003074.1:23-361(-)
MYTHTRSFTPVERLLLWHQMEGLGVVAAIIVLSGSRHRYLKFSTYTPLDARIVLWLHLSAPLHSSRLLASQDSSSLFIWWEGFQTAPLFIPPVGKLDASLPSSSHFTRLPSS